MVADEDPYAIANIFINAVKSLIDEEVIRVVHIQVICAARKIGRCDVLFDILSDLRGGSRQLGSRNLIVGIWAAGKGIEELLTAIQK